MHQPKLHLQMWAHNAMSYEARCATCKGLIEQNRRGHSLRCADCVWKERDRMKEATKLSSYAVYAQAVSVPKGRP